ncbi:MAG TPA: MBL fold metallo-hydrolase [Vicinamibacterales bacterium]|jgi:beta-lactamase superfamily II metal-dependent hydrolase|nr:MBL fold metallo-hydrolase [Vicinamibacterales bacterium]
MRTSTLLAVVLMLFAAPVVAQTARPALDIYVVDVEGGNAVLFVTPSGESVLIDSGNGGAGAMRDADRIVAAAKSAGLTRIDHLVTTHYHGDHIGGLSELAKRIPIAHFVDHGPNVQPNPNTDAFLQGEYRELYTKAKHTVAKPGDRLPLSGVEWRIVTSAAQVVQAPLAGGASANSDCAGYTPATANVTEDDQSVGSVITFGRFRTIHLGDLTLNRQFELMCPGNRIGTVDLLLAARHGNVNAAFLVHPLRPRAIVTNNGTRKGGQPEAMKIFYSSPGVEDIWQIHFSQLAGQEYAVPGLFTANLYDSQPETLPVAPFVAPPQGQQAPPAPEHNGTAYWFKISAREDGSFSVANARNGFSKTYGPRTAGN